MCGTAFGNRARRFDDDLLLYDAIEEEGPDGEAVLSRVDAVEEAAVFQLERVARGGRTGLLGVDLGSLKSLVTDRKDHCLKDMEASPPAEATSPPPAPAPVAAAPAPAAPAPAAPAPAAPVPAAGDEPPPKKAKKAKAKDDGATTRKGALRRRARRRRRSRRNA